MQPTPSRHRTRVTEQVVVQVVAMVAETNESEEDLEQYLEGLVSLASSETSS